MLLALMAYQNDAGILSRPAVEIADEMGLHPVDVRKALANLTRTEYECRDGTRRTILTQTAKGRRGHTAEYRLNIPREWDADGAPKVGDSPTH